MDADPLWGEFDGHVPDDAFERRLHRPHHVVVLDDLLGPVKRQGQQAPPAVMRGSASFAMRMNEWHDMSMASAKPAASNRPPGRAGPPWVQRRWSGAGSRAGPIVRRLLEYGLQLAGLAHVAGHDDRACQLFRERADVWLGFRSAIGDGEFGPQVAKRLGAAVGEAAGIRDPDDQALLALETDRFHDRVPQFKGCSATARPRTVAGGSRVPWRVCLPMDGQKGGCQPASAQSCPLTSGLAIRKQIASAISPGWISRPSRV